MEGSKIAVAQKIPGWYCTMHLHSSPNREYLIQPSNTLPGLDLQGNTFWEFRDTLSSHKYRMRRIVQYDSSVHYSEISVSPQWHQWLRHTRSSPPSLAEQAQDLVRQENLKILAAEVDRRWAAKPSFLDAPGRQASQPLPALEARDSGESQELGSNNAVVGEGLEDRVQGINTALVQPRDSPDITGVGEMLAPNGLGNHFVGRTEENKAREGGQQPKENKAAQDPWKKARGGPSEEWQPMAWDGNIAASRR